MSAPRLKPETRDAIVRDYMETREPAAVIAARHGVDPSYPHLLAKRRGLGRGPRWPNSGSQS